MTHPTLDTCGCCGGLADEGQTQTAEPRNRPGLPALDYRVGVHGSFFERMRRCLSAQPELRQLTARTTEDPSIALLDAWAVALDVLTFYQERFANEGYLRTATERRSILELARAIGYELDPGGRRVGLPGLQPRNRRGRPRVGTDRPRHPGAQHPGAGRAPPDFRNRRGDRGTPGVEHPRATPDAPPGSRPRCL